MRMLRITSSSVACWLYNIFYIISQKAWLNKKKSFVNIKYVVIFSTDLSETFLILRRTK